MKDDKITRVGCWGTHQSRPDDLASIQQRHDRCCDRPECVATRDHESPFRAVFAPRAEAAS